jgi:hypothetical protein
LDAGVMRDWVEDYPALSRRTRNIIQNAEWPRTREQVTLEGPEDVIALGRKFWLDQRGCGPLVIAQMEVAFGKFPEEPTYNHKLFAYSTEALIEELRRRGLAVVLTISGAEKGES